MWERGSWPVERESWPEDKEARKEGNSTEELEQGKNEKKKMY